MSWMGCCTEPSTCTDCTSEYIAVSASQALLAGQVLEAQQAGEAVAPLVSREQAAREAHFQRLLERLGSVRLQDGAQLHAFAQSVLQDEQALG